MKECDNPWHITCSEAPISILADKKEELLGWHKCEKDGSPGDLYKENNLDWVLVQFEEDNGFRGLPFIAEWRRPICGGKPYWGFQIDELNNIDYYKNLKAVAWMPWKEFDDSVDPFECNISYTLCDGAMDAALKDLKITKKEDKMDNTVNKPKPANWDFDPEAVILAHNIGDNEIQIELSPNNSFGTKIQMTHEQAMRLAIKILQCIHSANLESEYSVYYKL